MYGIYKDRFFFTILGSFYLKIFEAYFFHLIHCEHFPIIYYSLKIKFFKTMHVHTFFLKKILI